MSAKSAAKVAAAADPAARFDSREAWLNAFVAAARPQFDAAGFPLPEKVRASIGFPSTGARSKRIGECWGDVSSSDGAFETFMHPGVQGDAAHIADILTHELCHTAVGLKVGHSKPFKQCATAMGLVGRMTATTAGPDWHSWADPVLADLGPFPGASLNGSTRSGPPKQTTRMMKIECDECDIIARVSRSVLETAGPLMRCLDRHCDGTMRRA